MTPMTSEEFGAIRRRVQWTQVQVATFFDVQERTVSRWENGKMPVPAPVAMLFRLIVGGRITNRDIANTATQVADHVFA